MLNLFALHNYSLVLFFTTVQLYFVLLLVSCALTWLISNDYPDIPSHRRYIYEGAMPHGASTDKTKFNIFRGDEGMIISIMVALAGYISGLMLSITRSLQKGGADLVRTMKNVCILRNKRS